jgi:hypothetical protein
MSNVSQGNASQSFSSFAKNLATDTHLSAVQYGICSDRIFTKRINRIAASPSTPPVRFITSNSLPAVCKAYKKNTQSIHIHRKDGNWNVCRSVRKLPTFDVARARKPEWHICVTQLNYGLLNASAQCSVFTCNRNNSYWNSHGPQSKSK